jgi:hypothetical protein
MMSRTSGRRVSSTSLRELSPFDFGSIPTRASRGAVSSKIRPLESAMLISAMRSGKKRRILPPEQ